MRGLALLAVGMVAAVGAGVDEAYGQAPPLQTIDNPELVYSRDFTQLKSLRPLSNGDVIAVEGLFGEVVLLGADGRTESAVGKKGRGPNEYEAPSRILPLAGSDFSLLVDPALRRLLIIAPDGGVMVSEPWRLPMLATPVARDAAEGMYYDNAGVVRMDASGGVIEAPGPILRFTPGAASEDTLAMIRVYDLADRWEASPVSKIFSPGPNGMGLFDLSQSPFGAQDQWTLMADGRIVIARARPYRIDFVSTDGEATEGAEIAYDPIPVVEADRTAFIAGSRRGQSGGGSRSGGGSWSGEDGRAQPLRPPPPIGAEELAFPDTKPAFGLNALHVAENEIFVQRLVAHDADHSLIDVFDTTGRRTRRIAIPADRVLMAVTSEALYAIVYNEFDVQILERYAR